MPVKKVCIKIYFATIAGINRFDEVIDILRYSFTVDNGETSFSPIKQDSPLK